MGNNNMDSLKDIRYAKGLIKRRVCGAIVTWHWNAHTAIFSLVNTVLLRSLPVERSGEVFSSPFVARRSFSAFSYPNYRDVRDRTQDLSGLLVYRFVLLSLSRSGSNEQYGATGVRNYFDVP